MEKTNKCPIRQSGKPSGNNPAMNPATAMRQSCSNPAKLNVAIRVNPAKPIRQSGKAFDNTAIAALCKNPDFTGIYLAKHSAKHFVKQNCFAE